VKTIVPYKERLRLLICAIGLLLVLSILVLVLSAQSDRGTITGTVIDQTGAAMVGVSVRATNAATGVISKATSGANGSYTITLLPVGTYEVSVEHPGFKRFISSRVAVQVGHTTTVDIGMEVGGLTETLEVQAEEPLLARHTADLGTVITRQQFQDLPLLGDGETRNPSFFMIFTPGVTGRGTATVDMSKFNMRVLSTTVNGSQSGSTEFHLDGSIIGSGTEFAGDPRNVGFPPDAVGEFKMNTLNAPAEFGHSGGGIASFILRSGTNQLHGSLYEYFRNDALDARGFFRPEVPTNRQNEFGTTVGGPIHKDKTFYFGWFNGFRLNKASLNPFATVPTTASKQGDLGEYLGPEIGTDALGRKVFQGAIYDPLTTRRVTAGQVDPDTGLVAIADATALRDPFPGNRIPIQRIDRVARNILPLFPEPTRPGVMNLNNFASQAAAINQVNQWGTKVDHSFTGNHKIFGSFVWSRLTTQDASPVPGALSTTIPNTSGIRILRLSEDSILRPNLVNHTTFGFNRWRFGTNPTPDLFGWPAKLGITGVNQNGLFPALNINIGQPLTYGGTGIGYGAQNHFDINESLSWIKGRHTFKSGFEYLKSQSNDVFTYGDSRQFSFEYQETALPGLAGFTGTGQGIASFLLGWANAGRASVYTSGSYERSGYYAAYAQDDFKVTSRLTLNLGLRYDLYRPTVDKFNHLAWVDMKLPNPALGGFPGTMVFAAPDRRTGVDQFNKGFAPRFGLAANIDSKTVLRAGYGLFWAAGGYIRASRGLYVQGYNSDNNLPSPDGGFSPAFVLQNGWPASNWPAPPFISPTFGFGNSVRILDRDDAHPPYLQNWTLNVQRQLPGQILLDVAYVGNKGTRLQSRLNPTNHLDPRYFLLGDLLKASIADPAVQALPVVQSFPVDAATGNHVPFAGFESFLGPSATLGQALRPTPQYTQRDSPPEGHTQRFYEGSGVSSYHSLQVKLEKRFSRGLSFLAAYTWSKTLTNAESQFSEFSGFTQDPYNRKAEKSYSVNDYPHNLVINYVYELPFGPGKKFARGAGVTGKIVGGWKVAGIHQYQSGPPIIILTPSLSNSLWPYAGTNSFMNRPNIVPGVAQKSAALLSGHFDPNRDSLINPEAFQEPLPYTFGNGPRTSGAIRGFAYLNEDISLIKHTNLNERVGIEFRADFLNVFNRVVFGLGTGGDQYGAALVTLPGNVYQSNYPREIQFGLKINY